MVGDGSIAAAFRARNGQGLAALVPYLCAGYPSRDASLELLIAAADAGADVLELGIPFSDPLADGPTIQRATFQALKNGMTVSGVLDVLGEFRRVRQTPVVLFTYLNPIHRKGIEDFASGAKEAGAQGLLVTDLPVGADPAIEEGLAATGLDLIRLVAPTTISSRIPEVTGGASGFLYYISRTGVTGAREEVRSELADEIETIRRTTDLPIAVGFGISTPQQAALVGGIADGVVVGSALIDSVTKDGVAGGARFLTELRSAMDRDPSLT